jgi:hypothetical protein
MNVSRSILSRRTFLRAGAVGIALPLLDAMLPRGLHGQEKSAALQPRRMVLVSRPLGLHAPFLFPQKTGLEYEPTRYLKLLEEHRDNFTLFSGLSHKYYRDHGAEKGLFTGADWDLIKDPKVQLHNSVSLDQLVAEKLDSPTRFRNLVLGRQPTSWTAKGMLVPAEQRATEVFKKLFIDGTPDEIAREVRRLQDGKSILDGVREQAKTMASRLGHRDRDRIDSMFSSIRDAERQLAREQSWAARPKPKVDYPAPKRDFETVEVEARERLWFDIVRLALLTDSSRVINLGFCENGRAKIDGFAGDHHDSSHHGQDPHKIEQLAVIEQAEIRVFNQFIKSLRQTVEADGTLLDHTMVLSASNLGNASSHDGDNLPIFLAGGGLKHRGHVGFDRKNNLPLCNLYVRMLQHMGIETDKFGSSNSVVSEI